MNLFPLFLALAFILTISYLSSQEDQPVDVSNDEKLSFILPINWTVPQKYSLGVSIPEGYRPLQPADSWAESPIIEFIPKEDKEDSWSEIITINKFIGKELSAPKLAQTLQKYVLLSSKNGMVWLDKQSEKDGYRSASLGLSYDNDKKREVFEARYYSGPYDCVGVQYTIRVNKGESENAALEKIGHFFDSSIQIIESSGISS